MRVIDGRWFLVKLITIKDYYYNTTYMNCVILKSVIIIRVYTNIFVLCMKIGADLITSNEK